MPTKRDKPPAGPAARGDAAAVILGARDTSETPPTPEEDRAPRTLNTSRTSRALREPNVKTTLMLAPETRRLMDELRFVLRHETLSGVVDVAVEALARANNVE